MQVIGTESSPSMTIRFARLSLERAGHFARHAGAKQEFVRKHGMIPGAVETDRY
jgi:hypothetical protein